MTAWIAKQPQIAMHAYVRLDVRDRVSNVPQSIQRKSLIKSSEESSIQAECEGDERKGRFNIHQSGILNGGFIMVFAVVIMNERRQLRQRDRGEGSGDSLTHKKKAQTKIFKEYR